MRFAQFAKRDLAHAFDHDFIVSRRSDQSRRDAGLFCLRNNAFGEIRLNGDQITRLIFPEKGREWRPPGPSRRCCRPSPFPQLPPAIRRPNIVHRSSGLFDQPRTNSPVRLSTVRPTGGAAPSSLPATSRR